MSDYARGFLITLAGVLVLTPDTLLVRLVDAEALTQLFWRGCLSGAVILAALALVARRTLVEVVRRPWRSGLLVLAIYGTSNVLFVYSTTTTLVANTLFILATSPVFAALIARFVLHEEVPARTWATIAAVLCGVGIIAAGSGLGRGGSLGGDLAALGSALGLAVIFSAARTRRGRSIVPLMGVSALLTGLACGLAAPTLAVPREDWLWMALMGAVVVPLAFALIATGPRYLPAADVGLLMLLEAVLGPLLVWRVLAEEPGPATLAGGAVVIGALCVNNAVKLRADRRRRADG
jgi:drug/metabolite transporter (DMT)-like permease